MGEDRQRNFALQSSARAAKTGQMGISRSLSNGGLGSSGSSNKCLSRSYGRLTDSSSDAVGAAELFATQMALNETKAELAILRSRVRDKEPPSVRRVGGTAPGAPSEFSPNSRNGGAAGAENAIFCTKMKLPTKAQDAVNVQSMENELEVARLKYQLEELERDLSRAQRFLKSRAEEIVETNMAAERARDQERAVTQELAELRATALSKAALTDLTNEIKERGLPVQVKLIEAIATEKLAEELKNAGFDAKKLCVAVPEPAAPAPA